VGGGGNFGERLRVCGGKKKKSQTGGEKKELMGNKKERCQKTSFQKKSNRTQMSLSKTGEGTAVFNSGGFETSSGSGGFRGTVERTHGTDEKRGGEAAEAGLSQRG